MKHFRLCVLCLICMLVSFMAGAQTRTISISAKDEPVRKVLRQIELQSGYTFFYSDRTVDVDRRVTIEATDKDVLAVVNEIFDGYGVKCSIIDRNIVLTDDDSDGKPSGKGSSSGTSKYEGRVVDEKGQPVIGATVMSVSDNMKATSTDLEGRFSLAVADGDTLEVSFIGYATAQVKVANDVLRTRWCSRRISSSLTRL